MRGISFNYKLLIGFFTVFYLFSLLFAYPILDFTNPTETNGTLIIRNWTEINLTIDMNETLDTFIFNWNNTNYTFYDSNLVLMMNFNNNSAIGENSTHAVDISKYGNNGTFYGGVTYVNDRFNPVQFVEDYQLTSGTSVSYGGHNSSDDTSGYVYDSSNPSKNLWKLASNLWATTSADGYLNISYGNGIVFIDVNLSNIVGSFGGFPAIHYSYGCEQGFELPRQYQNFDSIDSTTNYTLEYSTIEGSVVYDIWLMPTSTYDWSSDKVEIMVWLWRDGQTPGGSYNKTVPFTVTVNGTEYERNFKLYVNGNNTLSYILNDTHKIKSGNVKIDLMDFFNDGLPILNRGNMWLQVIEFGSEYTSANQNYNLSIYEWDLDADVQPNKAVYFDGNNDYINIPHTSSLNVAPNMTLEMWVYHYTTIGDYKKPLSKQNSFLLDCGGSGSNTIKFNPKLSGSYWYPNGITVTPEEWTHIAYTLEYIGTTTYLRRYKNGVFYSSLQSTSGILNDSSSSLTLGAEQTWNEWKGIIDELRIYNRKLSSDEISMHHQSEFQKYNSTQWRFYNNVTNLVNEEYTYYGWVNDSSSSENQTELRTLNLDLTNPQIDFEDPTEANDSIINTNWTEVNITIDENNLDTFIFNWNSTNYTFYDSNLVLSLNFNNNSNIGENSTHAVDISGYGNNGTISGASWSSEGKFGGSMYFDGNDKVYCADPNEVKYTHTDSFTWCAWIKTTQASSQYIIQRYRGYQPQISLGLNSTGHAFFKLRCENDISSTVRGTSSINDGNWHYVVGVRNVTEDELYIYVDGICENNITDSTTGDLNSFDGYALTIGYPSRYSSNPFYGYIDEVRIYDGALSSDYISMHHQSEFQKYNSTQYRFYNNVTSITDGNYNYFGWANDTTSNENQTETRTLTIGCLPPTDGNWEINKDCILTDETVSTSKTLYLNSPYVYLLENTTFDIGGLVIELGGKLINDVNSNINIS